MATFKINEMFYSLQGEGQWAGTPCLFVRLAGCNLKCTFCDTQDKVTADLSPSEILTHLKYLNKNCTHVVVTGGEPLTQQADLLCLELQDAYYYVHLETNGMFDIHPAWDWVSVSPKNREVSYYNLAKASEIKFLVGSLNWEELIYYYLRYLQPKTRKWVMPVADGLQPNAENTKLALEFCLEHPEFSLCLQTHKYLNIR